MQQNTYAGRLALRAVRDGRKIPPSRFRALCRAGLLKVRGHGAKSEVSFTAEGKDVLRQRTV